MNPIKLSAVILFFISCGSGNKATQTSSSSNEPAKAYVVSGSVTQTFSYCGGARPSDEMLADIATPRAYPGKKFYIKKGSVNKSGSPIILSFTTDEKGNFSFPLQPGTYSIIQEEQTKAFNPADYKEETIKVDEECLKEWWKKPYYLLEIKASNIAGLKFEFHHPCFLSGNSPCRQYTGPLPE